MDFFRMHAVDLLAAYRHGDFLPEQVLDCLWQKIDRLNPILNAIVTENREESYRAARESAERIQTGRMRRLEGIPVAIKDLTNTKGLRTTYGSLVYKNHIPDHDATIVSRLKKAGAIIIGKTNTPEFGHKGTTNNRVFGATKNPWKLTNGVGGSSGGSAAAVAAGFCPLAEGSDGGGSIRIPSALCGVFGFKPSFGRVPSDNHPEDVFASVVPFISYGTIARSVRDAALMFDAIQGPSSDDPFSLDALVPSVSETLSQKPVQWRIGYTYDFGIYPLEAELRKKFDAALDTLREKGASVLPAPIQIAKDLRTYVPFFNRLWMIGLAESSVDLIQEHKDKLSYSLLSMIERGQNATAGEYLAMHRKRTEIWRIFQQQFETFDVLVSPTLGAVDYAWQMEGPERINGQSIDSESDWMMTSSVNLTGEPACTLPIGQTASGLPVGMQCIAAKLADRQLLQFAQWAEQLFGCARVADL
ncbi:amidase [Sporolactobacillus spathodeae]|uniref:Asp-tRNA(Asn)/Glu-tRNA(Gln) amidotransferase A subunit family amidase n=1 Tax=Sporolactobacillus spathodeae TaxID=1465502 RepID=A0ABS2Q7Y1_9BACL|nr:amidase [Sporolactobacillus spathodeae]MBM7657903.1 Asp-tRNA(Asn)/Glu-tRNA(Gln) amidotransferase A subunit family amidase [Sporolactobacillus spathodeae]